ncbi:UNVERIFIED_CONTAM: sugar ABC transporter [Mumia flava]
MTPPTGPPALALHGISRRFGGLTALDAVDVEIVGGEVHCVLGENGAGKSTLCNLVYGSLPPSSGRMEVAGRTYAPDSPAEAMTHGIAMVHQHFSLVPTLTVEENLLLGGGFRLDRAALLERLARIESDYGLVVELGARAGALSVGRRQRVEIVKALLGAPSLLLFDEPTGVLGPDEVGTFLATASRIAEAGAAVVLITHKLHEVREIGDVATVLRHGRVVGSGRLEDLPDSDLVAMMVGGGRGDLDPVLAAGIGLDVPSASAPPSGAGGTPGRPRAAEVERPQADAAGTAPVLVVEDLAAPDPHGGAGLDGASLVVEPGRIVGVAGVEGNGQSALVAALSGAISPTRGAVRLRGVDITTATPAVRTAAGLAVIPEDRHHEAVVADLSVTENLLLGRASGFTRFGLLDRRAMRRRATELCAAHDVRVPSVDAPMSTLSGGNQQKAVLARELSLDPLTCVVAAHPTRGLDVGAVQAVATQLRAAATRGVAVLVVSGELEELLALSDSVVVAFRGALLGPVDPRLPDARDQLARLMTGART